MIDHELNRKYKNLFVEFNQRYFGGKLPNYRVVIAGHITRAVEHGKHFKKSRTIKVCAMEHEAIIATLLHEMAHASVGDAHGERFCKEMERLASMGAPINKDEPRRYRESMRVKLNQRYFRDWADKAFADASHGISFRSFCRWLAWEHGEWFTAAFLRKHPSIRPAFTKARRDFLQKKELKKEFYARLNR